MSELAKSLFINEDTTNTTETLSNTKEYEIVMTDSGYARKYANGRYEYIDDVAAQAEIYKDTYGGEVIQTAYKVNTEFDPDTNGRYVHYNYGEYAIGKKWFAYIK